MMITRAPEYTKIAKRLVSTLPEFEDIRNYKPKFIVLASDEEKQKNRQTVFGQCYKTSKTYEWICPYDFFIVVYETNCVGFNEKQMETLLRHELNHIGVGTEGNDISYYVRPHDYEEFKTIICECGLDWSR